MSRKRFLRFWGLLVLVVWTSGSVMAACRVLGTGTKTPVLLGIVEHQLSILL